MDKLHVLIAALGLSSGKIERPRSWEKVIESDPEKPSLY